MSHDITWERCFTVRHETAISHVCSKGGTSSQIRLCTWMSFHRKELTDSCVSWSWLSGRGVVKIISMIKLQPSGDCAVWRMNRISARLCHPSLRFNCLWKGRTSHQLFKWRGYLKTLPPGPDYHPLSHTLPCSDLLRRQYLSNMLSIFNSLTISSWTRIAFNVEV